MQGTVSGAYGRDYKSKKDLLVDWNANKDFRMRSPVDDTTINKTQVEEAGWGEMQVRWKRDTQTSMIKRSKDGVWR